MCLKSFRLADSNGERLLALLRVMLHFPHIQSQRYSTKQFEGPEQEQGCSDTQSPEPAGLAKVLP
jgi:hypothetical protein